MIGRLAAALGLALWLTAGLLLTLQPVDPLPGYRVDDNIVPFRTIDFFLANPDSPFWLRQFVGNLILLLPVGLLGPIALPAINGWLRVLLVSFVLSLAIEVAQLWVPNRLADVDDVLLNVVGALIGYAALTLLRLGWRRPRDLVEGD